LKGELHIVSLKGGDGSKENSSLFMSSSFDCELEGILKDHPSPLFIPSISSIDPPTEENSNKITFHGIHFFPCSLSLSFSSDGIHPIESLSSVIPSFIDENSFSYSLSNDDLIQLNDFPLLYSSLKFLDHLNLPHFSSPFLVFNRRKDDGGGSGGDGGGGGDGGDGEGGGDGNLSEGGNNDSSSSSFKSGFVVVTVFFILSLLVIVGLIIFFIITKRRRKKKKGEKIKKEGREMNSTEKEKEIVFKAESEKQEEEDDDDDEEENKKEEEKKEKTQIPKSPSTEQLLAPNVESEGRTEKIVSEEEREKRRREEKEKEKTEKSKKEEVKKKEKIDIPD
jgi:preprotein translocase subunit SecG